MDASLSRSGINRTTDPHEWNSYDHYRTIHEKRLAEHPFVDHDHPDSLEFRFFEFEGVTFLSLQGRVFCKSNVVLEVEKLFETRYAGDRLQVRCAIYRYVAWTRNHQSILRYHNLHENHDEYHHRVFNPDTGHQIFYERLTRVQFPVFTEILDEIELVLQRYQA